MFSNGFGIPQVLPLTREAKYMINASDPLNIAFCPKLSKAKLVVVFKDAFSYLSNEMSYLKKQIDNQWLLK